MLPWSPSSWRQFPIQQQPIYTDEVAMQASLDALALKAGLVPVPAILQLKARCEEAARGERFLLQGGDCAESFARLSLEHIRAYTGLMRGMATIIEQGASKPVTIVGRVAGQYAKPRTSATETRSGVTLPSYRGDMINDIGFDAQGRQADPNRLLLAYDHAKTTLDMLAESAITAENREAFFCCHEGLLLPFEEALLRYDPVQEAYYASSAHMLWIGHQTLQLHEAHIEFMRGVLNPLAIKIGPLLAPDRLLRILDILNPDRLPGRVTCIVRHGVDHILQQLPPLLEAVTRSAHSVIWVCDPMHGNTMLVPAGRKTRYFDAILKEFRLFFRVLHHANLPIGGVHLELTPLPVTECVGGGESPVMLETLDAYYDSYCDPRLNDQQSLEFASQISNEFS